jgi:hypothetical protein
VSNTPIRSEGLDSSRPLKDEFYRERGIAPNHNGDVALAITDFDLVIRLERAFADIAQAMHLKKSHRTATSSKVSRLSNNRD